MKKTFYILSLILLIIIFNSCQKNGEVVEPDSVLKNSIPPDDLALSIPDNICAGKEFAISLDIKSNIPGFLQLMISQNDGKSWEVVGKTSEKKYSDDFYLTLDLGNYKIKGIYKSIVDGRDIEISSGVQSLEIPECLECESLVLEPNLTGSDYIVYSGHLKTFTTEYIIAACDQDYYDLTLRGKLISRASFKSSSPDAEAGSDKEIIFRIGDLKAGFTKTCKITFEYKIPEAPYGTLIPLTDGWVLEGKNTDGSTVITGGNNEIFVQIQ